ncbi:MAG: pyridoxal phosphate-dependent aminotransferase, partial [Spirochaetaceae bacterium]
RKSSKLDNVLYDIRGPILREAERLEEEGYSILKLHIGNPAPFGFNAPDDLLHDVVVNLKEAQGYSNSKGLYSARKAVYQYYQYRRFPDVEVDRIYIGNGVSELITMSMQALLDNGDEILIPAPDYPLWTAAVNLAGGRAVHYLCDEQADWQPDVDDLESKITDRTKGVVLINPNNPTGAVYSRELVERVVRVAERHGLIVFADEIYDQVLYDDEVCHSPAPMTQDTLVLTYSGLSKNSLVAGFRCGWMALSGRKDHAADFLEGLDMLANMRLCSNVPAQLGVQAAVGAAMGGYAEINKLLQPGGRLYDQRNLAYEMISDIPGLSVVKPRGAFYLFPRIDTDRFGIESDVQLVLDFLKEEHTLVVQGTGFNWPEQDHFRIVFLPDIEQLKAAFEGLRRFLSSYRQNH